MPPRKTRKSRVPDHQLLIFEIKAWEPSYSFAISGNMDEPDLYSEFAELHLDGACIYPDEYAGRMLKIVASSRREMSERPKRWPRDEERPKEIGLLELWPSRGSFYAGIPHDSLPFILAGLAAGQFRYVMLAGPSLKRGHSLTREMYFTRTAD